ncbi:hypothetical protein KI387_017131, partial [Taxus chinensis]
MVDVAGATDVADMEVRAGIGPSCETTRGKVDAGNTGLTGAGAEVGASVGGQIRACLISADLRNLEWTSGKDKTARRQ